MMQVTFEYLTGLTRPIFHNVRLSGSWDGQGRYSNSWAVIPMQAFIGDDGCPAWRATVALDDSQIGWTFHWGVIVDSPHISNVWGIPTETADPGSSAQHRDFRLARDGQVERYWYTHCRRLGANKLRRDKETPRIRFSVYAPNALKVETVIGEPESGYIWSDGRGISKNAKGADLVFPMERDDTGVWHTRANETALARFGDWDHRPYMFRVTREDGSVALRTDLHSRCQIGSGRRNPEAPKPGEPPWNGTRGDLDGTKSCSVVVDPEQVTALFREGVWPETQWLTESAFWANEFDPLRPIPTRTEDLVIYELHVGALGLGHEGPGTLEDALNLLDHLSDLGVNAVELLPMSEFEGWASWGYGTSHYYAVEFAGGGRDQFKYFVRECHRHGIAVILDVVYNHFTHDGERAEWMYDTDSHERNLYYWYQGRPDDYPGATPPGHGGYLDNGSTGYDPNFRNEMVRQMFIGSAAALMAEFHVDGFRMDLTQAIHRDNVIHANGASCTEANLFGAKFLREWVRTLRLVKPTVFLMAEDHTGWGAMTQPQETGGIGFDAVWYANWYHHLIGDATSDASRARLIKMAGYGGNEDLHMDWLGGALAATPRKVIYEESHDEAGNSTYQEDGETHRSARNIMAAVNDTLLDATRPWAEARCHVAAGLTLLSAGTPMFFMGEEVGAAQPYRYDDFLQHREDILGLRANGGAHMFRFYQDLIRLRRRAAAFRSPNVETLHAHNANRVLAFRRWWGDEEFLILSSLNNAPFDSGYDVSHPSLPDSAWTEVLNSDADIYGGLSVCNGGGVRSSGGNFRARIPANGVVVFQRL